MEQIPTAIPDKLFYKAVEVCQITDTQPYVLRFWESEFPQLAAEKNRSGQRVYRRQDIDLILRIKKLLYEEEYTIAGARKVLEENSDLAVPAHPPKARRKAAEAPEAVAVHEPPARVEARHEAPRETRPAPAPPPKASAPLFRDQHDPPDAFLPSGENAEHYRALYESALRSIDDLKNDLANAASTRDSLRERSRRIASRLQATLEP